MSRIDYYLKNRIKEIERETVRVKESFEIQLDDKILNLKIEKGIPIPKRVNKITSPFYGIAQKMEVGDSIEFPDLKSAQKLTRILKKLNIFYSCRILINGHFRVFKL